MPLVAARQAVGEDSGHLMVTDGLLLDWTYNVCVCVWAGVFRVVPLLKSLVERMCVTYPRTSLVRSLVFAECSCSWREQEGVVAMRR